MGGHASDVGQSTLVVIPTYNERGNIERLLPQILDLTPKNVHVLVVDDGSPDQTAELVRGMQGANGGRIALLEREGKLGLGSAYVAGFQWGLDRNYERFIQMDADFSHDPSYLPKHLSVLCSSDFSIASRYVQGGGTSNWSFLRRLVSRAGSWYARLILGVSISDFTGGYNGWSRELLSAAQLSTIQSDGYSFQIELKYRAAKRGFRWAEFPILFQERREGHSKMSFKILLEALIRVWLFRFGRIDRLLQNP